MSIQLTEILASSLNFLIFYFIVRFFFFKKINVTLEERNRAVKDNIDKAIADREEAELLLVKAKETDQLTKEKGIIVINEYKRKAEELYEDIVGDAREEAKLIVNRGNTDADREVEQARKVIRRNVIELATMLSKKAIGEDATEETHDRLVDDIISKVGEV
ncbi:MAG: F0F1 ATP synthase subunit B [Clostridiaceae bacterium]